MTRIQRISLGLGAPLLLAGVLGGAIAFAQEGGSDTPTPAPTEDVAPDEATPSQEAAPSEEARPNSGGRGEDCPEMDGSGDGSSTEASADEV